MEEGDLVPGIEKEEGGRRKRREGENRDEETRAGGKDCGDY